MYWFYNRDLGVGGAETLVYRLANHLSQMAGATIVAETVETFYEQNASENLKFWKQRKFRILSLCFKAKTDDVVFAFYLRDFLKLWIMSKFFLRKFKVVMYVLHPLIFDMQTFDRLPQIQFLAIRLFRHMLVKEYEKHRILFMDEYSIDHIGNLYDCKSILDKKAVFRLPYEIREIEKDLIKKKTENRKEEFCILAVARADFPFKGYLLGLVEGIQDIMGEYENAILTIISHGSDFERLEKAVKESSVSSQINLINKVPYNELDHYYKKAHVYIGMGSTLIEAAQYGAIPLVAKSYDEKLKIKKYFFYERPEILGTIEDIDYIEDDYMLRKVLDFADDDYYRASIRSREAVVDMYDIKKISDRIVKHLGQDR